MHRRQFADASLYMLHGGAFCPYLFSVIRETICIRHGADTGLQGTMSICADLNLTIHKLDYKLQTLAKSTDDDYKFLFSTIQNFTQAWERAERSLQRAEQALDLFLVLFGVCITITSTSLLWHCLSFHVLYHKQETSEALVFV